MTTIPGQPLGPVAEQTTARWQRYKPAHHWRSAAEEFDACKLGFWLFLATEVLLFGGIFCAYVIFRTLYPQAWHEGSSALDWKWGGLNTIVLLVSSYTMAASIYAIQKGQFKRAKVNLSITLVCGLAFLCIKLLFEYIPKWSGWFFFLDPALGHYEGAIVHGKTAVAGLFQYVEGYGGKRPGSLFAYPFAESPQMPMWWSVYYCGTAIHALHVVIGMVLIARVLLRTFKGYYGPTHYTMVEVTGLYWHLVDLIWIFLFPLLYLIH
jgi:cytochrome c oxidase subunit III